MNDNLPLDYPRPDFVRSPLVWKTLNGPWDFLFDDEDVGLSALWHQTGLPDEVSVTHHVSGSGNQYSDDVSITQQIAALPEKLLKDNVFTDDIERKFHRKCKIEVPFAFQTAASCVNKQTAHEVFWYERSLSDLRSVVHSEQRHRVLLRFGAVDYEATIWIDGQFVKFHRGGHVPFDVDITDAMHKNTVRLTVRVRDSPFDCGQPRGKQYWGPKPESIFYTPTSGIWQSVWLEVVPTVRIADSSHGTILRSNNIDDGQLTARIAVIGRKSGSRLTVKFESRLAGCLVADVSREIKRETDYVSFDVDMRMSHEQMRQSASSLPPTEDIECWRDGVALWSPEHPLLYNIVVHLFDEKSNLIDQINTTTGMRSLNWNTGDKTFRLNNRPYFQALVLDQGYWKSTGLTPPDSNSLKTDIEISKQMGFNGCRKHQKVEDPIFLYWADRLGYLVWGEMANGYWFNDDYVQRFDQEWMEAVRRDVNHPCIVTWTPVNESWGYPSLKDNIQQRNHIRSIYYKTKSLDPTRPVNDNCGWEHVKTDLTTFHEYADAPVLADICSSLDKIMGLKASRQMFVQAIDDDEGGKEQSGAPIICTEFGGVNIAPGEGIGTGERDWGYTTASDADDLLKRFDALVMAVVDGGHCCGFVYTQLTDIEQEVNGLYTFERTPKLDVTRVKAIVNKAKARYYSQFGSIMKV